MTDSAVYVSYALNMRKPTIRITRCPACGRVGEPRRSWFRAESCTICGTRFPGEQDALRNPIGILEIPGAGTSSYIACLHQLLMGAGKRLEVSDSAFRRMTRVCFSGDPIPEWTGSQWLPRDVYRPFAFEWNDNRVDLVAGPALPSFSMAEDSVEDVAWSDIQRSCGAIAFSLRARDVMRPDMDVLRLDQRLAVRLRRVLVPQSRVRRVTVLFNACDQVANGPDQAATWCSGVFDSGFRTLRALCAGEHVRCHAFPVTTWGFGRHADADLGRFPIDAQPMNVIESFRTTIEALQDKEVRRRERIRNGQAQQHYDVALSFAGEDRQYVEKVAEALTSYGATVFYDRYEEGQFWGEDLDERLADVYGRGAKFVVLFISRHYAEKLWTNRERQLAQARALVEGVTSLLPVRFDDTVLPGLPGSIAYIDARSTSPADVAKNIMAKLAN